MMKASLRMILSTLCGMLPAGLVATAYFAVANLRANDGPYFPPPLLALLVVIPVAVLLLPLQVAVLTCRRITGHATLRGGWLLGTFGGVTAGLTLAYGLSASSPQSIGSVVGFVGMGL